MASFKKNTIALALGLVTSASIMSAAPAVAQTDAATATTSAVSTNGGVNDLSLSLGASAKGVNVQLLDGSGKTIAQGVADDKGNVKISYDKVAGDVVTVKLGDKTFDLSSASCTVGSEPVGSTTTTNAPTKTTTTSTPSTTTSSTTSASPPSGGDGSTEGATSTATTTSATTPGSSTATSTAPAAMAAADPAPVPTTDAGSGVTAGGTPISSLVNGLQNGNINDLSSLLTAANGGPIIQVIGGINDIVKIFGGYENVKTLVNALGGPYAVPINSVISFMQALGLDKISASDGASSTTTPGSSTGGSTSTTPSTPGSSGKLDDQLEKIVDAEQALNLKTTEDGFSFNTLAGKQVSCKVGGMGTASDSTSATTSPSGKDTSSSSTDSTASKASNGAKVDTGGSIETEVPQPSLWDRFVSLF